MKYGVWVVIPKSWKLEPRFQLLNNEPFFYDTYKEAKAWADECNKIAKSDHIEFVYSVKETD